MLHLAAALDLADHPGAGPRTELVRLAEHGRLDFVTLDDPVGRPGPEALDLVSAMAAATRRIGLVPRGTDLSGRLDRVAQGRAGRWIEVPDAGVGEAGRAAGVPEAGESPFLAGGLGDHPADADGVRDEGAGPAPSYRLAPLHLVDASTRGARALAARYADVALVRAATPAGAAAVREELRVRAAKAGRAPGALRVLVSLRVDLGGGECAAEPGHGGG
uniref:LLM class flavin-dependent oxidoreductase n=1 Tax=Streptomyces sp. TR1341 TaxID=2601266 RepID=UPI00138ABB04